VRVALLGCGGIAARHAGAAKALGLELVGCVGRDLERTRSFATTHGGEAFIDLDRMIDTVAPEMLVVALPPFAHDGEVEHAAGRGLHLLVEKPLALDMATADRMVAAAEGAGVVSANGFMYRFGDAIRHWQAADTGRALLYAGAYHCNALHAPWWRDVAKSGGQLVEQAIHQIDLIRLLMGEPDTVYARRANVLHQAVGDYTTDDVSAVIFGWDDGRLATLNASNVAVPGAWRKEWALYAERLTGRFDGWNEAVLTSTTAGAAHERIAGETDVFVAQLADMMTAIRDRRPPAITLRDGVASLKLALAAKRSADERRELRLSDA